MERKWWYRVIEGRKRKGKETVREEEARRGQEAKGTTVKLPQ